MTVRGDATRAKLIAATKRAVRELGYVNTTTKAIADYAEVAEGTIYRHFPDKIALFFAAALSDSEPIIEELSKLPARAGSGTVAENLEQALLRLCELRQDLLPLELALSSDPDMARRRQAMQPPASIPELPSPPEAIADYLQREARAGRLRADTESKRAALLLLSALFGIMMAPGTSTRQLKDEVAFLVQTVLQGLEGR